MGALVTFPIGKVWAPWATAPFVASALPAVKFSPAWSLAAQSPAGMVTWMNAKAGVAIMTTINAETNRAARTLFTLLNEDLLSLLACCEIYEEPPLFGSPLTLGQ